MTLVEILGWMMVWLGLMAFAAASVSWSRLERTVTGPHKVTLLGTESKVCPDCGNEMESAQQYVKNGDFWVDIWACLRCDHREVMV